MPRRSRCFAVSLAVAAATLAACGSSQQTLPTIVPVTGQRTVIYATDGTVITELQPEENREVVRLDQVPVLLQNAVIAIEDERFWDHNGVDLRGIARAARSNTASGGVAEGGSTITQQYVKNTLLSAQRTIERKIEEASLALQIERTYSKQFILEQYLNTIFFGNRAYGVQVAAKTYFGRPVEEVTLPEAALLAGLIAAPARFDPYRNPTAAVRRRDIVLQRMTELGYITPAQRDEAKATPLPQQLVPQEQASTPTRYPAAHFVEEVKRFIRTDRRFGDSEEERNNLLLNGGLRIYTTIDLTMQAQAESAVQSIYPRQWSRDPDVGLVAIQPSTGYVRAMVGGYDFFDPDLRAHSYAQYNLAAGKGRQVGSTFKPIALAAALSNGIKITDTYPAPGRATIRIAGHKPWNVSGEALGRASLFECTVQSANTCFANLVADRRVLPQRVTDFAAAMGIDTGGDFQTVPSEVLGTNDTTVLEMTGAYDTFANGGVFVPPAMVTKVVRADGTVLYQHQHSPRKVIEPEAADAITKALQGVLERGTAAGRGIDRPAAGKTGTTQDNTDAWFIGYTPDLVTGVWTGFAKDTKRKLPGVGARMAAPVWQAFMKSALAKIPPRGFTFATGRPANAPTTTVSKGNTEIFTVEKPPQTVTMPALVPGDTNEASAKARRVGLRIRRVDVDAPGQPPGTVLAQSPGAGSKLPSGSEVVIEATPGTPPPTVPLPDVIGQDAAAAVANMQKSGWVVSTSSAPAPPGWLLPSGQPPAPGQIWQMTPAGGTVVPDGKVAVVVQP